MRKNTLKKLRCRPGFALKGRMLMRNNKKRPPRVGCVIAWLGVFILLALVLPPSFWWFIFGAALIYVGLCVVRW